MKSLKNLLSLNPQQIQNKVASQFAERYLPSFIQYLWNVIEPGTDYVDNWHIHLIGEYLHAVNLNQIKRLIINVPPRHMKSIEVSVCYPVWTWLKSPEKRFIKVSYNNSLSRKHNLLSRDIIRSPLFQSTWQNNFSLSKNLNRQNMFQNDHQGFMYSTSVNGSLIGEGGDVIILDDPQNSNTITSEKKREAVISFFTNTLQTRLNNPQTGAIIIVMQRLHEKDLSGHLLAEHLNYHHLCLPAAAPERTVISFPISKKILVREEGDLLNPLRFNKEALNDLKISMGSSQFSCQFQQSPTPDEGVIFKREWLNNSYKVLPTGASLIQSWDLPFKNSKGSAKCAGVVMARKNSQIFFVDCINEKMSFTESVAAIKALSAKYPAAHAKIVEDKANGPAIISFLQKDLPGMIPFDPKGSKQDRAISVAPYFEAGNVLFPEEQNNLWVRELKEDLHKFPNAQYKDTVDAAVQGILYLMNKPNIVFPVNGTAFEKENYWRK